MEKMDFDAKGLKQKATGERKLHRRLFRKLRNLKPSELDGLIIPHHHRLMEQVDCLSCANCCKSISPALNDRDVGRIARSLRIRPSEVVTRYLDLDEDGDYVFRSRPCPFLGEDNYCSVYAARPRACREYPHTDRARQHQILDITYRNIAVCPVVYDLVSVIREELT